MTLSKPALLLPLTILTIAAAAQSPLPPAPSATPRPLVMTVNAGIPVQSATPGTLPLSLDEAIQTAIRSNTQNIVAAAQQRYVHGQILTVGNTLLPNLSFKAYSQTQEIDLAAMGFKPSTLASINIPGFNAAGFSTIVKVNTTDAELNLSQQLFNVPAYFLYRAAQKSAEATNWQAQSIGGGVIQATGAQYLRILADQSQIANAAALVAQDQVVYDHAVASRDAGVGINLDVLRAKVQLQSEQQQLITAQNAAAKDTVQLNRLMGQPAGQALALTSTVPFAELENLDLAAAMKLAEDHRKDLHGLKAQLEVADKTRKAVGYQYLPTLGVGGFYGVLGETTGSYHGVFAAEGKLSIPVFQEALFRGQREVASAQITAIQHRIDAKRADIEADLRSTLLDLDSYARQVRVARSNVDLASQALSDSTDRFNAGVDDSLPLVRAQTALVGAQNQQIQAEFQYNLAKLNLARNSGVVEEYNRYLKP